VIPLGGVGRRLIPSLQEVIPMRSRAYRACDVNDVLVQALLEGREGQAMDVGIDVAKARLLVVLRFADGRFERPWKVNNPRQLGVLISLLKALAAGRRLRVGLEPTGSYGQALRQALADAGIETHRVNTKASHDYAETFDGVPSQHDGKDAAVIVELLAQGRSRPWPYTPVDPWQSRLLWEVERLDLATRIKVMWGGRVESVLGGYWPEATMKPSHATLLRALIEYGDPRALACDPEARRKLRRWGGALLSDGKIQDLLRSAAETQGLRPNDIERRRIQDYAGAALASMHDAADRRRRLAAMAEEHPSVMAVASVVGRATACVLHARLGDARNYPCGKAYLKAMGLNLAERSSGRFKGKLKISKRGHAQVRHWLYLAALRTIRGEGVRQWYQRKCHRDDAGGRVRNKAVVAVMRKLALACWQCGACGAAFDARRLFATRQIRKDGLRPTAELLPSGGQR
jgi:transposase